MVRHRLPALVVLVVAVLPLHLAGAGAAEPAETHCTVEVVGRAADGRYLTGAPRCFGQFEDVARSLGVGVAGESTAAVRQDVAALAGTIAVHFDGFNFTGSSLTVSGSDCAGGYLNLATSWRNRISSTFNGCQVVRFYNLVNMGGTFEATVTSGNLTTLNNKADSVQYSS